MMTYPPYKAAALDPTLTLLRNRLLTRCAVWNTTFGPGLADWVLLQDAPKFPAACRFELLVGTDIWYIYLNDLSCILRHEAFSSATDISLSELPHAVQKAVLNALLMPAVNALQDAVDVSVSIRNIEIPFSEKLPEVEGLGLKIRFTDGQAAEHIFFAALIPADRQAAVQASERLMDFPLRPNPAFAGAIASIPLEVAVETGYLSLNIEEMHALAVEDLLLPSAWYLSDDHAKMRIYHGSNTVLAGGCSLGNDTATLVTPLSNELDIIMDSNTNDIEIRLSFELDRRLISIGELASIAPGFTFPINSTNDSLVTVRANGKAIARGRIVDMDGTIGVQLTETL